MTDLEIAEPRLVDGLPMHIAGVVERYPYDNCGGIPRQWERFGAFAGRIPNVVEGPAWGVCADAGNQREFDYYAGVEVRAADALPEGIALAAIPPQHYAVFRWDGNIVQIKAVLQAIWTRWLPASGRKIGHGPTLERYGEEFDPVTGDGGFEIWLPLRAET